MDVDDGYGGAEIGFGQFAYHDIYCRIKVKIIRNRSICLSSPR